jgi:hypothetical protein
MNNWGCENPCACGDHVDRSNLQTTNVGKVERTSECFSVYGTDDLRAKIEPSSCWQYKPGDFLEIGPLNWDEIVDEDDHEKRWADRGSPSGGQSNPPDGNHNENGKGYEDKQGGETGTGKEKGTQDAKGKGKGN